MQHDPQKLIRSAEEQEDLARRAIAPEAAQYHMKVADDLRRHAAIAEMINMEEAKGGR